jgi:hypothetical protein
MGLYPNGTKSEPYITSHYGPRTPISTPGGTTSSFHTGVDYTRFTQVKAVRAGRIVYAGYSASNGNEIKLDHGDGTFSRYYHLARFVRSSGSVSEGETLGIMGMTGMATGVHLHFRADWPLGTHHDPRAALRSWLSLGALTGTQRQVLSTAPANRRIGAPSITAPKGEELAPGTIGNFNGWIRGDSVSGNNVWFRGISGDWFWSGGFTDTGTHDLADLNPVVVPPAPTEQKRTVGDIEANVRDFPSVIGVKGAPLPPGTVVVVTGYVKAPSSTTSNGVTTDIWFRHETGWSWAGGFTSQSIEGLTAIPVEFPSNVLDPTAPWKNQTPDSSLAKWVGSPNYNRWPAQPVKDHLTFHWMSGTLAGTDAHFNSLQGYPVVDGRGTGAATNYGVGQTEIHQYIKEKDYQHGDGDRVSNTTGVSIEHEGGPNIPITDAVYALSAKLSADIAYRNGFGELVWLDNVFPHSHWTDTQCPGTLDYARIIAEANRINGYVDTPTDPEVPDEPDVPLSEQVAALEVENAELKQTIVERDAEIEILSQSLEARGAEIDRIKSIAQSAEDTLGTI